MVKHVDNYEEFMNETKEGLVLVDFFATWCGPCKMLAPIVEEVANELEGKVKVIKVDVDKNTKAAMQYHISSIPTLIVFKNGEKMSSELGYMPKAKLLSFVSKFM